MYFYLEWDPALSPFVLSYPPSFCLSYLSSCSLSCCQNKVNPLREKKTGSPIGNVWQVGTTRLRALARLSSYIDSHQSSIRTTYSQQGRGRERRRKGGKEREEGRRRTEGGWVGEGKQGGKYREKGREALLYKLWVENLYYEGGRWEEEERAIPIAPGISCSLLGSNTLAVVLPRPAATTADRRRLSWVNTKMCLPGPYL